MENVYWNDIGSFDAIAEVLSDKDKNVFKGDILAENCTDTMIIGDNRLIAGIDLENLMIIDTPDALLVAKKGESQKVKNIVNKLKQNKRKEQKKMSLCIAHGENILYLLKVKVIKYVK